MTLVFLSIILYMNECEYPQLNSGNQGADLGVGRKPLTRSLNCYVEVPYSKNPIFSQKVNSSLSN